MQYIWTEYHRSDKRKACRLIDSSQRIIGRVVEHKVSGGGYEYDANCYLRPGDGRLGRYLSLEVAKQRVEQAAGITHLEVSNA